MTTPIGRWERPGQHFTQTARVVMLALAGACGLLFYVLYVVADRTLVGQQADDVVFRVMFGLVPGGWPVDTVSWFARDFVVEGLTVLVLVMGVSAIRRRAWNALFRALVLVVGSVVLTLYLRDDVLIRERLQPETFPVNSMPSTHASAATALVAATLILWSPTRPWWLPNSAVVVVLLVVVGNVVSQAHRPSDVVGSLLLVVGSGLLVTAVSATTSLAPR